MTEHFLMMRGDKAMMFSELELERMDKDGVFSVEDEIKYNILNFIRVIHLNRQNFIQEAYASEYFGKLPMTFRKNAGQVAGLVTAMVEGALRMYVFTDRGYEELDDLLSLK
jgi:hypothetical protein